MARSKQVDSAIPRGKAAFHAVIPAAAFLLGHPTGTWIAAITGVVMLASVLAGPRGSVFGLLFQNVVRPLINIKPGRVEEAAPHRFAELVGALFLLAASAVETAGLSGLSQALILIVVALATLNALAGICVGCQLYLVFKRTQAKLGTS